MMMPQNGTLLSADGESTVNIADLLGGEKTGEKYNMDTIAPKNGVFLNSKGEAVDITKAIID